MPSSNVAIAGIVLLVWAALGIPAAAQNYPAPPPEGIVCPAIEEDGLLCGSDPMRMTGNCTAFVAAADRLGGLYRAELQKLPDSKDALLSTSWWGCGPSSLYDVKRLLASLASAPAAAVLEMEPYRSLPAVPTPPPPPPTAPPTCDDLQNPVERNLCAGAALQAVRSYHQQVFDRCKTLVAGPLRDELVSAEASFEAEAVPLCEADTEEAGESAKFKSFDRAVCLVKAYQQRTASIVALHPECQPTN